MWDRTKRHSLLAIVAMLIGAAKPSAASPISQPATQSTTQAATQPAAQLTIQSLLQQIASDDPALRDQAEQQLMALKADDLPSLKQGIVDAMPLHPGESQLIQDVVTHVVNSDQSQTGKRSRGFIGIEMKPPDDTNPVIEENPDFPTGVVIANRLPGFAAYRMLRNGDMILSLSSSDFPRNMNPEAGDGPHQYRVRSSTQIAALVGMVPAGHAVTITLLRNGQRIDVPLKLAGWPPELDNDPNGVKREAYQLQLQKRAEDYWQDHFAELLGESPGGPTGGSLGGSVGGSVGGSLPAP